VTQSGIGRIEIPQCNSLLPYWGVRSFLTEAREARTVDRRSFIALRGGAGAAWPLAADLVETIVATEVVALHPNE